MLVIKQSSKAWICNTASRAKQILSTGTVSSFLNCLQPNKGQPAVSEETNTLIQDQQHICLGLIQLDLNTCFTMTLDWSWQSRNPAEGVFCRRHKGLVNQHCPVWTVYKVLPFPVKPLACVVAMCYSITLRGNHILGFWATVHKFLGLRTSEPGVDDGWLDFVAA